MATQNWLDAHGVVAIGASAGGIDALQRLMGELPMDLPAAVCVVLHIPSSSHSLLAQVISRQTQLPVSQAIAGERLVFLHRLGNEEIVECLHPETGSSQWQFRYPTAFEDRYGYNNGPRSSPVIDEGRVYTVGAEGKIHCLDLGTGKVVWRRDLRAEYRVPQDFFGTASTPLVEGRLLLVNVGAPGGPSVAGLDKATGREAWRAGKEWGPSYASPVPATMHGKRPLGSATNT